MHSDIVHYTVKVPIEIMVPGPKEPFKCDNKPTFSHRQQKGLFNLSMIKCLRNVREHCHKQTHRKSMHNCTEGAATQIDTVQQSMVNEEYRMSFKKEEMSMNKDIFFFQSLFPAE